MTSADPPEDAASSPPPSVQPDPRARLAERLVRDAEQIEERLVPGWLRPSSPESRVPVITAILAAVALQYAIPDKYGLHPRWLIPSLELVLLAVLSVLNPLRMTRSTSLGRYASYSLVAAITLDNASSAAFLDHAILTGTVSGDAAGLLASGAAIYLTNIVAFGIWYWELDRGGPFARAAGPARTRTSCSRRWPAPIWLPRTGHHALSIISTSASPTSSPSLPPTRCPCHAGPRHSWPLRAPSRSRPLRWSSHAQ